MRRDPTRTTKQEHSPSVRRKALGVGRISESGLLFLLDLDVLENLLNLSRVDVGTSKSGDSSSALLEFSSLGKVGGRLGGEDESREKKKTESKPDEIKSVRIVLYGL